MTFIAGAHAQSLEGTEWGFGDGSDRFIQFRAENKVSGFAGCNRFVGSVDNKKGIITIGPLAVTKMACPPEKMRLEDEFLKVLDEVRELKRSDKTLRLLADGSKELAVLQWRDWD